MKKRIVVVATAIVIFLLAGMYFLNLSNKDQLAKGVGKEDVRITLELNNGLEYSVYLYDKKDNVSHNEGILTLQRSANGSEKFYRDVRLSGDGEGLLLLSPYGVIDALSNPGFYGVLGGHIELEGLYQVTVKLKNGQTVNVNKEYKDKDGTYFFLVDLKDQWNNIDEIKALDGQGREIKSFGSELIGLSSWK